MAFSFTKSAPATGAVAMYELKERLKTAGWTVLSSSDGTTYNSSGDQISSGGSGANGFANNSAWIRLQSPSGAGAPQLTLQRGTTNLPWRIKYSMSAGFSDGSPGATRTPSATDEAILWGSGTDASPTTAALFSTDNTYRWNVGADSSAPYGWWSGAFPLGGGDPISALVFDPLTQTAPTDAHSYAIYGAYSGSGGSPFASGSMATENWATTSTNLLSSIAHTSPGAAQVVGYTCLLLYSASAQVIPQNIGTNPLTSDDEVIPILLGRRTALANPGYKGVLSLMKWAGTGRSTGDTLSVSTARDRIIYRNVSLPWDGSVPSV